MPENLGTTLDFLRDLREHNNKAWFDENRKRYDVARGAFEDFITDLIHSIGEIEDLAGVTVKECVFRINRDVRFSHDKSPYKTSMSGVIARGGRKAEGRGFYVHIEPDNQSMLAGGLYMPTPQELDKVRQNIAENSTKLKKIIHNSDFTRYFGSLKGETLKTAPQGYPKDHPDIELLRFKQFLAQHDLSNEQVLAPDLTAHVVKVFKALQPLLTYLQSL